MNSIVGYSNGGVRLLRFNMHSKGILIEQNRITLSSKIDPMLARLIYEIELSSWL